MLNTYWYVISAHHHAVYINQYVNLLSVHLSVTDVTSSNHEQLHKNTQEVHYIISVGMLIDGVIREKSATTYGGQKNIHRTSQCGQQTSSFVTEQAGAVNEPVVHQNSLCNK